MTNALATQQKEVLAQVRENPLQAIMQQYDQIEAVANVMFPPTALDNLPPMHKPSPTVIRVEKQADTYPVNGKFGLSKHVVQKMLAAAGASYRTRKLTPESDLDNIRWTAEIVVKQPDGTVQMGQGSKSWSWAKCQEEMEPKQAFQYRKFADEQTETKAILRAARGLLAIKTSYTQAELEKPFVFLRTVFNPDMSDPEIRKMVAEKALNSSNALWGESSAPQLPSSTLEYVDPDDDQEDDEPIDGETTVNPHTGEIIENDDYDPLAAPPVQTSSGAPNCSDCGGEITAASYKDKSYSVSDVVDITVANYGKPFCFECSKKQQKKQAVA